MTQDVHMCFSYTYVRCSHRPLWMQCNVCASEKQMRAQSAFWILRMLKDTTLSQIETADARHCEVIPSPYCKFENG